ncbi:MAG: UvrD-helicase domain-containing protein [Thermoleophilia bacterium]
MTDSLLSKLTDEQRRAVLADDGAWMVSAGAGSGKTRVIERRYVRLVKENKAQVNQVLTITFTRKAAAEMGRRIRDQFRGQGLVDAMRQLDRAEISTIHGFCSGLVRRHALALGLDPGFTVIEEEQASILKRDSFERAIDRLVGQRRQMVVEVLAAYDSSCQGRLFISIDKLFESLRSRGEAEPGIVVPEVDFTSERTALRQAIEAAIEAININKSSTNPIVKMQEMLEVMFEDDSETAINKLEGCKVTRSGKCKEELTEVMAARNRLVTKYQSIRALPTLEFMGDLLTAYGEEYAAAKNTLGFLDFSDLELNTIRLLKERPDVEAAVAAAYVFTMVDEFQDTNPLQFDIIKRIAPKNLFVVGDANQSIYRFRHAEVELFQRIQRETDESYRAPLPANFRSQPEIIDFIDDLFTMPGMIEPDGYIKLEPRTDETAPEMPYRVEVLLVDADSGEKEKANITLARAAEAELIARRLHDLFYESGKFVPGETALLVRTGKDIDLYSQALDRYGIPNYLSIGRDFYERLEFGDALSLLRLVVNPLDDLALISVLRSPMVGVSDDLLLQLRLVAGRDDQGNERPLWPVLSWDGSRQRFEAAEQAELDHFVSRLTGMREASRHRPLADTVRDVINYNDYCAVAAAGVNGKQAYANLMKLRDKAATYETAHGRDLPGLVNYLSELKLEEARETQAPVEEEEGGGAVRIMTIHGAKGLEFGLVVWANMSNKPPNIMPDLISGMDNKIGLRYKELGQKHPVDLFDYDELAEEDDARELEEGKRVGYVAITRTRKHLILCGSANIDKPPEGGESHKAIEWIRDRFDLTADNPAVAAIVDAGFINEAPVVLAQRNYSVGLTVCSDPQALIDTAGARAAAMDDTELPVCDPAIAIMPGASHFQPAVVNATDIDTYRGCSFRYYLDRFLGVGALAHDSSRRTRSADTHGRTLNGAAMGTLVHAILEEFPDLSSPQLLETSDGYLQELAARVLGPDAQPARADFEAARLLLAKFASLETGKTVMSAAAAGKLRREVGFMTLVGDTILRGKIDALVELDDGSLVIDYKTGTPDASGGDGPGHYRYQMAAYALAAGRLRPGPVRVVLLFLGGGGEERIINYGIDDVPGLEQELAEAIDSFGDGFAPLAEPDDSQCHICSAGPLGTRLCPAVQ